MNIKDVLFKLTSTVGVSGCENGAAITALSLLQEYAPDAEIDHCGNVIGRISSGKSNSKTLMLDAHIDQIGMIVTDIDEAGFIKVGSCGGLDMRVLLAQSVTIHGKEQLCGVVSTLPPHISSDHSKVPEIAEISVDVGMTRERVLDVVSPGDRVTLNSHPRELCGDIVTTPAADDRSGVCAILAALEMLRGKELQYDLAICFSAQEETGERGVKGASFRLEPDEAIVVDVSFGRTPDSVPHETAELSSGVMIGTSAVLDHGMSKRLHDLAQSRGIPHTTEVMPSSTGTNADSVSVSRGGVKCCTLSIPIRYMHTPIETLSLSDIESTARLICEYVTGGDNNE